MTVALDRLCDPIVFVHLSDLHFREPGSPLAEREAALRDLLIDDIPRIAGLADGKVEAVLLTGDVARSAQPGEYREARFWLGRLCDRLGIHPTKTLTCPGNHDVDWNRLDAGRRAINEVLRKSEPHLLDERIDELLLTEPDTVLGPLQNYQEFAAGYACEIEKCLAWELPPHSLGNGYAISIRGGNSVINSDKFDGEGTMAVQLNQLLASRQPGLVRMLLLHHSPAFWVRPNPDPAQCHHNVVLYGHTHFPEHSKVGETCLEITAGAVHPEEREQFSIPGYNVIEISIEAPPDPDAEVVYARIRVFHREFSRDNNDFIETDGTPAIDEHVEILRAAATGPIPIDEPPERAPRHDQTETSADESIAAPDEDGDTESRSPLETASGDPEPVSYTHLTLPTSDLV